MTTEMQQQQDIIMEEGQDQIMPPTKKKCAMNEDQNTPSMDTTKAQDGASRSPTGNESNAQQSTTPAETEENKSPEDLKSVSVSSRGQPETQPIAAATGSVVATQNETSTTTKKDEKPQQTSTLKSIPTRLSYRRPYDSTHRVQRLGGKYHILLAVTGSVAAIKVGELIQELYRQSPPNKLVIKVIATPSALNFFKAEELAETVYDDRDEWNMWKKRGDPVLHIELRKWADSMLIAPLDANTLAKVAIGMCDNLVTSVVRAWDQKKPLYFAPAMNTAMWDSPLTYQHMKTVKELLLYREIPPIEKELMCGDKGYGAMASLQMIASIIAADVKNKFAIYSYSAVDS